ncbi:MAG: hypothetical protein HC841_03685 [Verrucomicrobiae bacterium]|nr:hypothetical protein [Verrucomicrobiae bacterium]
MTPPDAGFIRVLELLRSLQRSGHVSLRVKQEAQSQHSSILTFRSQDITAEVRAEAAELRRLLKLDPEADEFSLVFGSLPAHPRELAVLSRSILHIMSTMAAQVDVPEKDLREGRATPGAESMSASSRLVQIHSGANKPGDAFVSVRYHDTWYWIDDRDLRTKRAFAFMMTLFTLAESGKPETPPLITIPAQ